MPILHAQFKVTGRDQEGNETVIPPAFGLQQKGPIIQVAISSGEKVAKQWSEQGIPIVAPVVGHGLIDTGASSTCIDEEVAKALKLPIIDVVKMSSASHASTDANLYPIQIQFPGIGKIPKIISAIGANIAPQGIIALIGRDILFHATVFYNGPSGQVTIAF